MLSLSFQFWNVLLSSSKLSSFKWTSFFDTLTWWFCFISVGGSWPPVNQTGTTFNLSLHHFQPFCSKDESWFKGCSHTLIWRLTLLITCVREPGWSRKVNEDFRFKTLYSLTVVLTYSFSYFHYKGLLWWIIWYLQ